MSSPSASGSGSGPTDVSDAAPRTSPDTLAHPGPTVPNGRRRPWRTRLPTNLWRRLLVLLGYAGPSDAERRARRRLVSFIVFLGLSVSQIIVIAALTAYAAVHKSPPTYNPRQTEFAACTDLAVLNLIWLGRVVLICYLVFWARWMKRYLTRRRRRAANRPSRAGTDRVVGEPGTAVEEEPVDLEAAAFEGAPAPTAIDYICPLNLIALHILLIRLSPALTLVWFVTAVLLSIERGSRCRDAAPTVSALTVALIAVIYIRSALITLLSLIRVILARRRAGQPTIGKLSQSEVDRIPLVLYIPPPPGEDITTAVSPPPRAQARFPSLSKPSPHAPSKKKKRFIAFRPRRHGGEESAPVDAGDINVSHALEYADPWNAMFEPAPYPLVRLPENKATCMICLCEFEAPRKLGGEAPGPGAEGGEAHEMTAVPPLSPGPGQAAGNIEEVQVEAPRPTDTATVDLADAVGGDGPQPLRLLSCGHAYHKDCIDPWLTQKSGRCPYCQARVEAPPDPEQRRRRWWRRRS
ncbi:hypothetical protein BD414DRAFT_491423 [Trametes punicea]|nr:hypothetical protein BD414DRAFT_491423 [Trametes punicea]